MRSEMFMRGMMSLAVIVGGSLSLRAQDKAHWGVMSSGSKARVPEWLLDLAREAYDFRELDDLKLEGYTFNAGVVRFNTKGAPSFALQFSKTQLDITGTRTFVVGSSARMLDGTGVLNGFMATKYANFYSNEHVSVGIGAGGGVGRLKANSAYTDTTPTSVTIEREELRRTLPLFEIFARLDIRPAKPVSFGPEFGLRNGAIMIGGAVKIHF
ncbi:MAG: hypothetical protein L0387_12090 [Acidobacteria bacterium]|nr:hypothetical protein [Acidobacteriota bacterium]MCI0721300.1 hypothetical protein [Acidobacteriota bacterium]